MPAPPVPITDLRALEIPLVLSELMRSSGLNAYKLAERSEVDRAYLSNILSKKKWNLSWHVTMRLCYGLATAGVSRGDLDRLLVAARYAPIFSTKDEGLVSAL